MVTLHYRAPELLLGCSTYSTAVDMWSLGCIMGELLKKAVLFRGQTEIEQLDKIYKLMGTPNSEVWPGFDTLPVVKDLKFKPQPFNLRSEFPKMSASGKPTLTDAGFSLLMGLLVRINDISLLF